VELDYIIGQLNARKQRATYGAVAGIAGGSAIGLMHNRSKSHQNSWVVAKTGGRPTGYTEVQIHPDCRRSILERPDDVIADAKTLESWLKGSTRVPTFRQL